MELKHTQDPGCASTPLFMVNRQMNFSLIGSSRDDLMRNMKQRLKPLLAGDTEGKNIKCTFACNIEVISSIPKETIEFAT